MKQTRTVVAIVAVLIVVIGAVVILSKKSTDTVQSSQTPVPTEEQPDVRPAEHDPSTLKPGSGGEESSSNTAASTYTLAEVATHASASSCWSVVNGGVYDLTTWINRHPGGPQAILGICGIDATAQFEAQHGGQNRPEQTLASFKIGVIK